MINMEEIEAEKMSPKQQKIVEAAIEIFAEKGFAATSTNEIAKKAGVAEGTIFRYYKTKKQLLLSIATPMIIKSVAPIFVRQFKRDMMENEYDSLEDFVTFLVKNRYEFAKKNAPIVKIVIQEVSFHEEIKEELTKVFMTEMYPTLEKIFFAFKKKVRFQRSILSQPYFD